MRVNQWSLQNGKGSVLLTCHQMAALSPQIIVPHQGLRVGLCCWQARPSKAEVAQLGLGKWEFMLLGSCVASISANMAIPFVCPLCQFWGRP